MKKLLGIMAAGTLIASSTIITTSCWLTDSVPAKELKLKEGKNIWDYIEQKSTLDYGENKHIIGAIEDTLFTNNGEKHFVTGTLDNNSPIEIDNSYNDYIDKDNAYYLGRISTDSLSSDDISKHFLQNEIHDDNTDTASSRSIESHGLFIKTTLNKCITLYVDVYHKTTNRKSTRKSSSHTSNYRVFQGTWNWETGEALGKDDSAQLVLDSCK